MKAPGRWWEEFPGSGASQMVREWLELRIQEIQARRHGKARAKLRAGFRRTYDLTGMPTDVRDAIERYVDIAQDALRSIEQPDAAAQALYRAQQIAAGQGPRTEQKP